MFVCRITNKLSQPGEKCHKIVTRVRSRTYSHEEWAEGQKETVIDGRGWEVEEEVNATQEGVNTFLDQYKGHPILNYNQGLTHAPPTPLVTEVEEAAPAEEEDRAFPALREGFYHLPD